jgi:hypothetical protein
MPSRADPDGSALLLEQGAPMRTTYAVTWQSGIRETRAGRLELRQGGMIFEGSNGQGPPVTEVPYDDVSTIRVARLSADRLGGRPTLVLERHATPPIRIASIAQTGIVAELAERLARVLLGRAPRMSRFVVVVPLQEGAQDRVRALLRGGAPFDLDASGLRSHQVFLTASEAVFYFDGDTLNAVEKLSAEPHLWTVASEWKDVIAGSPRVAQEAYSWVRPASPGDAMFAPTPGPGDSEGGDLFAP